MSVDENQRHTVAIKVRCSPEVAARVRRISDAHDVTLARLLEIGAGEIEKNGSNKKAKGKRGR